MFVVSTAVRRVRDLALWLRRLAVRALGGQLPEADSVDGPPAHWVEYVRRRAPQLLQPGGMRSATVQRPDPSQPERPSPNWSSEPTRPAAAGSGPRYAAPSRRQPQDLSYGEPSGRASHGARPDVPENRAARPAAEPASAGNGQAPRRRWSWPASANRELESQPATYPSAPPPTAGMQPVYPPPDIRVVGPMPQAPTPPVVTAAAPPQFAEWSSATLVEVDATEEWLPGRGTSGTATGHVFDTPAAVRASSPSGAGYAEPYDPWPSLPEAPREEVDWRSARNAADAERRLRREQRRL